MLGVVVVRSSHISVTQVRSLVAAYFFLRIQTRYT